MHFPNISSLTGLSSTNLETNFKERSHGVTAGKLNYATSSSREFCRTLDKYGIDIQKNKMTGTNAADQMTVLAHKDHAGNYKLETGLYISNPKNGDAYGDFKFYQGRGAKKYQTSQVAKLEFDKTSLERLSKTYHEVPGATKFLSDLLALRPCKDLNTYISNPELFSYLAPDDAQSNGFLIFPNLPYIDTPSLLKTPTSMKDKKEGIAVCAYAVHPNQDLRLINHMKGMENLSRLNTLDHHSTDNRTAHEMESGTTVKYLSSILDLDVRDVPMLETLHTHILDHLYNVYEADKAKDKVQLFFHFPVAEETSTLHLHARVNKADHPLNEARSFELIEVIDTLRSGRSIIDMILGRNNGVFYTGAHESVAAIQDIPNKGSVHNPYLLPLSQPFEGSSMFRSPQET
ncbi:hypothetical protein [Pseudomonas sp. QTF5]|uniref:hypothetical protein n=1 Tax=Pseudomonas sp. QTF5 TaxID=1435425 RepID=UPI0004B06DBA|nr:hypothetical protein [Pseudomonas sp. QTF5]